MSRSAETYLILLEILYSVEVENKAWVFQSATRRSPQDKKWVTGLGLNLVTGGEWLIWLGKWKQTDREGKVKPLREIRTLSTKEEEEEEEEEELEAIEEEDNDKGYLSDGGLVAVGATFLEQTLDLESEHTLP